MTSTGRPSRQEISEEEKLDLEMQDEINEQRRNLFRYFDNIDSLLGKQRANEVKKSMINVLVENL